MTHCPTSQQDVGAPNVITALCGWSFLGVVWNNGSSKLHTRLGWSTEKGVMGKHRCTRPLILARL